jgi:tetratricopeptide (TPR) repeat protein
MAKVSLRSYNRDIEGLIENEQVAEAVAHCQHILKTFPKHLETYRLLGKAYLEARRYADAADIFQRVLMAVPDDFVSHVGMSIIRDDENKLDEAIWHMERAFEAQPSNAAVQGELRRLYGRRDGMEPPKIRMTRGALAHMYLQGQLYSQAIAEIRAVLADEPQRVDMQALLAKAYFFGGHRVETTELCTALLKKYPYSLEANRVMVEILPSTGRAESTQVYRHRVNQLDPYATFATGSIFELAAVPDAAVNLERLEYEPGQAELLESGWASSLGINLESERPDTPPAWLKSSTYDEVETPPALPAATPNTSEDIPDFLREAGWKPSTGEFKEGPMDLSEDADESAGSELTPADIPDWLQNMAPEESETEKIDQADLDFLSTARPPVPLEEIPDWLKNAAPVEATEPAMRNVPDQDATPDWLKIEDESAAKPEAELPAWESAPAGGEGEEALEIPDWLGDMSAEESESEPHGPVQTSEMDVAEVAAAPGAPGVWGCRGTTPEKHKT